MTTAKIKNIEDLISTLENKEISEVKSSEAIEVIKPVVTAKKYEDLKRLLDAMVTSVCNAHQNTPKWLNERNAYCAFALLACNEDYPALQYIEEKKGKAYVVMRLYSSHIKYGKAMTAIKGVFEKKGIDIVHILSPRQINHNLN